MVVILIIKLILQVLLLSLKKIAAGVGAVFGSLYNFNNKNNKLQKC